MLLNEGRAGLQIGLRSVLFGGQGVSKCLFVVIEILLHSGKRALLRELRSPAPSWGMPEGDTSVSGRVLPICVESEDKPGFGGRGRVVHKAEATAVQGCCWATWAQQDGGCGKEAERFCCFF